MLEECEASVNAQTYSDVEHLIGLDEERRGCSWTMNQLAKQAAGEWLFILADDDLLFPRGLETLLAHADGGDVVWSRPVVWGNASPHLVEGWPPQIPSHALVRTNLWRRLGGYDETRKREEDRDFWKRAMEVDARFIFVPDGPTWLYRFRRAEDGSFLNKSHNHGVAR